MKKNNTKLISFLVIALFFGAYAVSALGGVSGERTESEKSIILIEKNDSNDFLILESMDVTILQNYENMILVEIESKIIEQIQQNGFLIRHLPFRNTLYIKDLVFDGTINEIQMPPQLYVQEYAASEKGLFIVHMIGPVASEWRALLENVGVEVLHYIPNYAYLVWMNSDLKNDVLDLYFVDWVDVYHPYYKFEDAVMPGLLSIGLLTDANRDILTTIHQITDVISFVETYEGYRFVCSVDSMQKIYQLANINEVVYIAEYNEPALHAEIDSQIIGGGTWILDDDNNPSTPYREYGSYGAYINQLGYTGDGVTIAIADTGLGDGSVGSGNHPDFTGRVLGGCFWSGSGWQDGHGHGTHCAGSIGGDTYGNTGVTYAGHGPYYVSQGLAYKSDLYSAKIFSDSGYWAGPSDYYHILEVPKQNADAYVHSNSWGTSWGSGTYIESDNAYDRAARDADSSESGNQPLVMTVSAGNSGSSYKTIGSPGNSKNVITVGATESYMPDSSTYGNTCTNGDGINPDKIVGFSSRGWTADNRIKPDIVATGQAILSASTPLLSYSNLYGMYTVDSRYEWCSGTSMSNPAVAGAAAVTVQWYEINHGSRPSPAMVKSLLINTAHDLDDATGNTDPIPNRDEGWGMVDISKLQYPKNNPIPLYVFDQDHTFTESGQIEEFLISSDSLNVPFKVSLVWTDKEAASGTGSGRTLINDLHLEVVAPSGCVYRGNAFSNGWTIAGANTMSVFDYSGDGWDDTNTVENVYIHPDDVEMGFYTIRVKANLIADDSCNVGCNSQDFSLVVYNGMEIFPFDPPTKPSGPSIGTLDRLYHFSSTSSVPDGEDVYFFFDWGDGTNSGWIGPYSAGAMVTASHSWSELGNYSIKARFKDANDGFSGWSEPHSISIVENQPPEVPIISGPTQGKPGVTYLYRAFSVDADGDSIYYMWDWGDGTMSEWIGPFPSGQEVGERHSWDEEGSYEIKVKTKDSLNLESEWSDPLPVTMPYRFEGPFMKLLRTLVQRFPLAFPILRNVLRC
jgi:serine protease AprX